MSESRGHLQRQLPPHPASAGEARRMVQRVLADAGRDDLVDTAQLLVSEIVTNALVHTGTAIDLCLDIVEDGVRVQVGDGSAHLPVRRTYGPNASTGRGLAMLERSAEAWGVLPSIRGKTVWFQLAAASDARAELDIDADLGADLESELDADLFELAASGAQRRTPPGGDIVNVELLNVPLLLHTAWHQHAEAMLREFLLVSLELDLDDEALRVHAAATAATKLLARHIPTPQLGDHPSEVMSAAVEPHVSSRRVEVPVPSSSLPHFDTLDWALEAAIALAEQGMLLTPPVQPEMRTLRRWLCDQVEAQSRGENPTPWPDLDEPQPAPRRVLAWDASWVSESPDAVIAADDTNRIVAVSHPALELLGYDYGKQLIGQRVLAIIPRRYRQAHLAGFTLHLLTGRRPLLGHPVEVPVRRRDGSEATVELTVDRRRVAYGRTVFIATLEATAR